MKKSLFDEILAIVFRNRHKHPERRFLHFTFIIQRNRIVEWGRNHTGIPAKHMGYQHRIKDKNFKPKIHSEWDAYKKARGLLVKNTPFEIVNVRLNRKGQIRLSKPCECCYYLMKEMGCRAFHYSSEVGFLTTR